MREQRWLWPDVRARFFEDLERLHEKCGPWDLVLFTGDLTQRGSEEEFKEVDHILEELCEKLKGLGSSDPHFLAVPGNHDLVRPAKKTAAVRALIKWEDAEIREEFWADVQSEYRQVITEAFADYTKWWEQQSHKLQNITPGLLPGDFSATIEKDDGAKLGIVGLNTSFLQLTNDNYEGKLALHSLQFQEACNGDGPKWAKQHQTCLLLTHHPPLWLNPDSQQHLNGEITAHGRFAVHLCGHAHETVSREIAEGGAEARRIWQGRSLFGLEYFGENDDCQRLHGYTAGRIELHKNKGTLQLWPREARLQGEQRKIAPDYSLNLTDDQHTPPRDFRLLQSYKDKHEEEEVRIPGPPLDQIVDKDVSASDSPYPQSDLPPQAQHFTDRVSVLSQLCEDLQPGRVVALCGPGGMGKSALAREAIELLRTQDILAKRFPDGVFGYDFYSQPNVGVILTKIAQQFGDNEPKPPLKEAVQRALSGKHALFVLEGAEKFEGTEEVENLEAFLRVREDCGVLVTSRKKGDAIIAERWQEVRFLKPDDAVMLLRAWGGDRAGDNVSTRQICKLVGGLPLAVQLVGRFLSKTSQTTSEYLEWLQAQPLKALDQESGSVNILLARSLEQVSKEAQQILAVIGQLAAELFADVPLAEAMNCPLWEARIALGELVNYGFLLRPEERYKVSHALIHTYARESLSLEPEVLHRLIRYYIELAETESHKGLKGYQRLDAERVHIVYLLKGCKERGEWEAVRELIWAIGKECGYLDNQVYWMDWQVMLETGIKTAQKFNHRGDEGTFLGHLGIVYRYQDQEEKAIEYHTQALTIAREVGDRANEGRWLGQIGIAYHDQEQLEKSMKYFEQALVIAQEVEDRSSEARWLGNLGQCYRSLGQIKKALDYHEQVLAIAQDIGDSINIGRWLGNLGLIYHLLGQEEKAIDHYEQALEVDRQVGNRRGERIRLNCLGDAYSSQEQMTKAIEYYEQALALARQVNNRRGEGDSLSGLGTSYSYLGQKEKALEYHTQAIAIASALQDRHKEGHWLVSLGATYSNLKQVEKAIEYYDQALKIAQELGDRHDEGNRLHTLGNAYRYLGQVEKALKYYNQALNIEREVNNRLGEENLIGTIGAVYKSQGQMQKAIEYYDHALEIDIELGNRRGEGWRLISLSDVYLNLGQIEKSIEYIEQALIIFGEMGDRRSKKNCFGRLGNDCCLLEQFEKAIEYHEQALAISLDLGDLSGESIDLGNLSFVYQKSGQAEKSIEYAEQSLDIFPKYFLL